MVVVGPRHMIASSALPSRATTTTKTHLAQQENPHHHHHHHSDVSRDSWRPSATTVVDHSVTTTTELKQQQQQQQQQVRESYAKNSKGSSAAGPAALKCPPTAYAFVYGTLKRGFSNYWLMDDVVAKGHARFLGTARTKQKFPMVCGPYQVPFLIDLPAAGHHVRGELYEVDCHAIERLDDLEGVSKGNYVRRSIVLSDLQLLPSEEHQFTNSGELVAQVYFAAPTYASRLAEAPHIEAFTEKESATYVRRKDRPQNRTFLQHIEHWIKTQELVSRSNNQCATVS